MMKKKNIFKIKICKEIFLKFITKRKNEKNENEKEENKQKKFKRINKLSCSIQFIRSYLFSAQSWQ